jgi:hypothetical protein
MEPDIDTLRAQAEQGDANAQYRLGGLYRDGTGVQQGSVNLAEASWVLGRVGPGLRGHEAHVTAFHSANARVRSPR